MPLIHSFNKQNFKQKGKFYNAILQNGDKCWIDLEDASFEEMFEIHKIFHIDMKTLKQYFKDSQKSQLHIFRGYNFTIIRSMNILTPIINN
jgi:Mg2+ and Co2+ transporter CorA